MSDVWIVAIFAVVVILCFVAAEISVTAGREYSSFSDKYDKAHKVECTTDEDEDRVFISLNNHDEYMVIMGAEKARDRLTIRKQLD